MTNIIEVANQLILLAGSIIGILQLLNWGSKVKLEQAKIMLENATTIFDTVVRQMEQMKKLTPDVTSNELKELAIMKARAMLPENTNMSLSDIESGIEAAVNHMNGK